MVYAKKPLQGIVKRRTRYEFVKYSSGERRRLGVYHERVKEMAGSDTKLEKQQRERNPHVQSGFWRGSACETAATWLQAAREGLRYYANMRARSRSRRRLCDACVMPEPSVW